MGPNSTSSSPDIKQGVFKSAAPALYGIQGDHGQGRQVPHLLRSPFIKHSKKNKKDNFSGQVRYFGCTVCAALRTGQRKCHTVQQDESAYPVSASRPWSAFEGSTSQRKLSKHVSTLLALKGFKGFLDRVLFLTRAEMLLDMVRVIA